jgi:hypothetical protein
VLALSPFLIPLFVLAGIVVLFGLLLLLGRIAGGKYLRSIMQVLVKVPLLGRGLKKMSAAALERQNPELASAVRKLERMNATRDPQRAQAALSQLSADERRAYLEAIEEQGAMPEPANRAQRRQMEKARKRR